MVPVPSRNGISLGQLVRPLESVGCYVPGGRFPLVSTLLMTVIPAQVAGVKNIRVVSPRPSEQVLAAAGMLGIREFYRIGGAQAIAALAYGTGTISGVDKIVGPGNLYVTAAKKLVAFDCAIDMLAGPTEIVIVSADRELPRAGVRVGESNCARAYHDRAARSAACSERRVDIHRRLFSAGCWRLCFRSESCASNRRRSALSRRIERDGFCEDHHSAGTLFQRPAENCADGHASCRS